MVLGINKDKTEVIVSTEINVITSNPKNEKFSLTHIPNHVLCELKTKTCEFSFTKLEKKINLESQRKPKPTYNHIVHEEIIESIDAVDKATDFGGKFISDNQVVLGGFENAFLELSQVQDLLIQAIGSSYIASQYGAYIFKQLKIFNTVRVVTPQEVNVLLLKNMKHGGFLTVSRNGGDLNLVKAIKLAYTNDFTCMNIVNQVDSPITKAIDEVIRERKEQEKSKDKSNKVLLNLDIDSPSKMDLLGSEDSQDSELEDDFQDKNIGMYSKSGNCYTDMKTFIP